MATNTIGEDEVSISVQTVTQQPLTTSKDTHVQITNCAIFILFLILFFSVCGLILLIVSAVTAGKYSSTFSAKPVKLLSDDIFKTFIETPKLAIKILNSRLEKFASGTGKDNFNRIVEELIMTYRTFNIDFLNFYFAFQREKDFFGVGKEHQNDQHFIVQYVLDGKYGDAQVKEEATIVNLNYQTTSNYSMSLMDDYWKTANWIETDAWKGPIWGGSNTVYMSLIRSMWNNTDLLALGDCDLDMKDLRKYLHRKVNETMPNSFVYVITEEEGIILGSSTELEDFFSYSATEKYNIKTTTFTDTSNLNWRVKQIVTELLEEGYEASLPTMENQAFKVAGKYFYVSVISNGVWKVVTFLSEQDVEFSVFEFRISHGLEIAVCCMLVLIIAIGFISVIYLQKKKSIK